MRLCSIRGCEAAHYARGWCSKHYARWRKHGDPNTSLKAERGAGFVDAGGYRRIKIGSVVTFEHRTVMEESLGRKLLPGENVHHINGDKLDNRLENLELWASVQPNGQRVSDLVDYAYEILRRYG